MSVDYSKIAEELRTNTEEIYRIKNQLERLENSQVNEKGMRELKVSALVKDYKWLIERAEEGEHYKKELEKILLFTENNNHTKEALERVKKALKQK